ncbi:hypothetical protein CHS0354_042976 [Potamilus streckersoni]|uniref:Uncharacterized protein n=1 Tax=Potamilus streckersoni TaxID=2493646 RepID=A0AAE0T3X9_9BIVA|nr:hypothetical protein CHS0354_042976 [Potamilus streckersoni]
MFYYSGRDFSHVTRKTSKRHHPDQRSARAVNDIKEAVFSPTNEASMVIRKAKRPSSSKNWKTLDTVPKINISTKNSEKTH